MRNVHQMKSGIVRPVWIGLAVVPWWIGNLAAVAAAEKPMAQEIHVPECPDPLIVETYEKAATQNVLAAVNPEVFFGYFSVCADGRGHGYGNTYPALDGHQMTDALLWLGQVDVVKANWDYVRKFQKPDGQLPFAIWPSGLTDRRMHVVQGVYDSLRGRAGTACDGCGALRRASPAPLCAEER